MIKNKLIASNKEIKEIKAYKKKGKKIVLCHGSFDLIHPGHLNHFEEAKKFGDILVVTITADNFIKKNIHSPFYSQDIRINFLKNLKVVDYAFIVNDVDAIPAIETIKPNYYCKGLEYKKIDKIGNLNKEKKILFKNKGKIKFLGKAVESSSKIISKKLFKFENDELSKYSKEVNFSILDKVVEKIKNLKVIVIGETIVDKYTFVKTSGVSPKANTLSCTELEDLSMPGGTLATFRFLSSFIKNIEHISIVNKHMDELYKKIIKVSPNIIKSSNYKKLVKKRIVERGTNTSLNKILTINEYEEGNLDIKDERTILNKLKKAIPKVDLVIVQDFGHGFFTKKIKDLLQKNSKKLSINVQTNSLNYGFNIINKQYKKAKIFSIDERELELFTSSKELDHKKCLKDLTYKINAKKGFLTCGAKFSLLFSKNKFSKIPVINKKTTDTVGAGDIFHAIASVSSFVTDDDKFTLFLAQIAGAHAVDILGNSDYPKLYEIINTVKFYENNFQKYKL